MKKETSLVLFLLLALVALAACSSGTQDQEAEPTAGSDVASGADTAPDSASGVNVASDAETGSGTSADPSAATGLLEIVLTDAPPELDVTQALVTISSVKVHRAGEDESSGTETEAGWFTIVEESQTFDLIALEDAEAFLGSADLEPGKYTQIRLSVNEALATIDGEEHDLKVPSDKIKLVHQFTIEAGQTTRLTLDFDAQESIHAAGKKYMMRPTIKVLGEGPGSGE